MINDLPNAIQLKASEPGFKHAFLKLFFPFRQWFFLFFQLTFTLSSFKQNKIIIDIIYV